MFGTARYGKTARRDGCPVRTSRRDGPFSKKALHDNGFS